MEGAWIGRTRKTKRTTGPEDMSTEDVLLVIAAGGALCVNGRFGTTESGQVVDHNM